MQRTIGTSAYGLRAPIIKSGDCLKDIVVESLDEAVKENSFKLRKRCTRNNRISSSKKSRKLCFSRRYYQGPKWKVRWWNSGSLPYHF